MSLVLSLFRNHSGEAASRQRAHQRVAAYLGFLTVIACLWTFRCAQAELTKATFALGRDLLPLADLLGDATRLNVNGEHIWASSSLSPASVHDVLDRFENHCRGHGVTGDTLAVPKLADLSDPQRPQRSLGVLRSEERDEGAVLCFVEGKDAAFLSRLETFSKTPDLGEFGHLRYTYVRHERGSSHVLTLWTDEHLRLDRMAGIDGSEPGSDNPDLPRPIGSRRTVSAAVEGTPYGVRGYVSQLAPSEILRAYSQEMKTRGWLVAPTTDDDVRGFMKEGSLVTIRGEHTPEGTVIGIAEMGNEPQVYLTRARTIWK